MSASYGLELVLPVRGRRQNDVADLKRRFIQFSYGDFLFRSSTVPKLKGLKG
ncbi:MAG: hypothetical protein KKE84_09435 [Gammaproteobacteria bacterium]|nr:hypothetical protein [Gammaproteobacteria bacterium]